MRAKAIPIFAMMAAAAAPAAASAEGPARTVTAVGEAEAQLAPDSLTIELSVQAERPSAGDAAAVQAGVLASVMDALKASGVSPRDVATIGPTLSPFVRTRPSSDGEDHAYRARSILNVRVRELGKTTDLVRITEIRGAQILAYHYDIADRDAREDALRTAAVENARHRAELYAAGAGMKVGAAHAIIQQGAGAEENDASPVSFARDREAADADSIAAGAVLLSATVYVTFDLEPK